MKLIILLLCCALPLCAGAASAQYLGQMGPLEGQFAGRTMLGVYLGAGQGNMGSAAELRTGTSARSTAGLGVSAENGVFGMQADLRSALLATGGDYPLDLGGQLAAGFFTGDGVSGLYAQAVPGMSFEWTTSKESSFSTWAGLGLRLAAANSRGATGVAVARLGTRYDFSPTVGISASVEDVGGNSSLIAGAGYSF